MGQGYMMRRKMLSTNWMPIDQVKLIKVIVRQNKLVRTLKLVIYSDVLSYKEYVNLNLHFIPLCYTAMEIVV